MNSRLRLQLAATVIATTAAGLAVVTTSAANAETGCKSGSVVSGPAHGWYLQICKTPYNGTTDKFSWTARNTDSGAAAATVSYTVQCTGGTSGFAAVAPPGPASWGGWYSPACAFHAELNVGGAPGPGGAPIILNLSAD
ncbi:hypothetical protein GCM10023196_049480 [Actinoallomurus vinaceus]|uniref:Secreted protein n=1 Tax=Actinoallomurus vinaceus TaxID=1080074 RepID=A0ABP8UEP7_9ACTN